MSTEYVRDEDGEEPLAEVPEEVLQGIEDIAEGRTSSKEDVADVLKF